MTHQYVGARLAQHRSDTLEETITFLTTLLVVFMFTLIVAMLEYNSLSTNGTFLAPAARAGQSEIALSTS